MTRNKRKPSYHKASCEKTPNFSGQHFLHHPGTIEDIVNCAKLSREDVVIELGAGKGALTTRLVQKAGKVLAIEYDPKLVERLIRKTSSYPNISIIQQDILKLRFPKEKFVVVSNIPYAITTPIMKLLLAPASSGLEKGIIVMEKGAARRFTSASIRSDYVLYWRMFFDLQMGRTLPRGSFTPPPSVDSVVLVVKRRTTPIIPYKHHSLFKRFAEWVMRHPDVPLNMVLKSIFTPAQIKQLRRRAELDADMSVSMLDEWKWGEIFLTMIQVVPKPFWPKPSRHSRKKR